MKKNKQWGKIFIYFFLIICSLIFIFPILIMVFDSLKTKAEFNIMPAGILPKNPQFINFLNAFTISGSVEREISLGDMGIIFNIPVMLNGLINTLVVTVLSTIGMVLSATMCAFGFSKIRFPGRELIFKIIISTIMIPGAVLMIPLYILFNKLGWLNTLLPLWAPLWLGGGAFNIFLTRQFMKSIPNQLIESSKLDGAGWFKTYYKIILPNCLPIIIVIVIQHVLATWNDIMGPIIYINTKSNFTLAQAVANMGMGLGSMGGKDANNLLMAACTMMAIVPITIFFIGQKYIVDNMVITGVKG